MREMALSVRQPWATLIVQGLKTIEVRSWRDDHRGHLFIHASRKPDEIGMKEFPLTNLTLGAIIGSVELIAIERFTRELWRALADQHLQSGRFVPGLYAWHFANQKVIVPPIPLRGSLKLFPIELSS